MDTHPRPWRRPRDARAWSCDDPGRRLLEKAKKLLAEADTMPAMSRLEIIGLTTGRYHRLCSTVTPHAGATSVGVLVPLALWAMPESPRWFEAHKRHEEAERVVARLEGECRRRCRLSSLTDPDFANTPCPSRIMFPSRSCCAACNGVGHLGAVFGPIVAGALFAATTEAGFIGWFAYIIIPGALIPAFLVAFLGINQRGAILEQISA